MRTQLKFFEQLDQMEKQRKEEQEREILMKAAKVSPGPLPAEKYEPPPPCPDGVDGVISVLKLMA